MAFKNKYLSVLALSTVLLTSCGRQPYIDNVVSVNDPAKQEEMYQQVLDSKIATQSDGTYTFKVAGTAKLGALTTDVNGYLNYNFDATNSKVTADITVTGVGLTIYGFYQDDQIEIKADLFGLTLFEQSSNLTLPAQDLPEIINFSLLGDFNKDECLTNYRTGRISDEGIYNLNLFEVRKATDGLVCPIPTHFRENPTVGFMYAPDLKLKGVHVNAKVTFNNMDIDVVLNLVELNS